MSHPPRVLVVAQHFHPAPVVAAVRWTAITEELGRRALDVAVMTQRQASDQGPRHPDTVFELPRRARSGNDGDAASDAPAPERGPSARARLRSGGSLLAVPDSAAATWFRHWRGAARAARRFAPDVVVSTSPPHSLHLFARALSRRLGAAHVVDLRDPYVGDPRYDRPTRTPWRQAHRRAEARIVGGADAVLTAGVRHHEHLVARYPAHRAHLFHVPNGFHAADHHTSPPRPADGRIRLVAVGTAAPAAMDVLAGAVARSEHRFELHTVGISEGAAQRYGAHMPVVVHPRVLPEELGPHLDGADVLVLALSALRGGAGGTSTKLYQYIDSGRPILALNPTREDQDLLRAWSTFRSITSPTVEEVAAALDELVAADDPPVDLDGFRARHSWAAIGGRVAEIVSDLAPTRTVRRATDD